MKNNTLTGHRQARTQVSGSGTQVSSSIVTPRQSVLSAALRLSAASECATLFMDLCSSHVLRWMVTNAPPAAHSQFLLSQL